MLYRGEVHAVGGGDGVELPLTQNLVSLFVGVRHSFINIANTFLTIFAIFINRFRLSFYLLKLSTVLLHYIEVV